MCPGIDIQALTSTLPQPKSSTVPSFSSPEPHTVWSTEKRIRVYFGLLSPRPTPPGLVKVPLLGPFPGPLPSLCRPRLLSFFSSPSHHLSHPNRRSFQATPPLIPSAPLREATYYLGTHLVHGTEWGLPTRLTASQTRSGEHRRFGQPFQVPNLLPTAVSAGHRSSGQKNGWHQTTPHQPSASHRRLQAQQRPRDRQVGCRFKDPGQGGRENRQRRCPGRREIQDGSLPE